MKRSVWWAGAAAGVMVLAVAGTVWWYNRPEANDFDASPSVLTLLVLGVAIGTLYFTVPAPARLTVDGLDEAEISDLIFYVSEDEGPRDILLQLHVGVANVGDHIAVLTAIKLVDFLDSRGQRVEVPQIRLPLDGHQYTIRHIYLEDFKGGTRMHREMIHPPFGIGPHDVVVVRFRSRGGATWEQDQADLPTLQQWHDDLLNPIVRARIVVMYRRAGRTRRTEVLLPLEVLQQVEYAAGFKDQTEGFTKWPALEPRPITGG